MTIIETVLIYAGIPALVIAVITGLVLAGDVRRGKRYRPGRPYDFRPVWFLSAPERHAGLDHRALGAGGTPAALPPGATETAGEWPAEDRAQQNVTGGASDRW